MMILSGREKRFALRCDASFCRVRFHPRRIALSTDELRLLAERQGWACNGEANTDFCCYEHARKALADLGDDGEEGT